MSYVTVHVDIDHVLNQMDSDDLKNELSRRAEEVEPFLEDRIQVIFETNMSGRFQEANCLLDNLLKDIRK